MQQNNKSGRLHTGDMALVDSRKEYAFLFPEQFSLLSVQLPLAWLETWLDSPAEHLGQRIDGSDAWGRVLPSLLFQLKPKSAGSLAVPDRLIADQVGSLLCLALQKPGRLADKTHSDLDNLTKRLIDQRSAEPGLGRCRCRQGTLSID